MEINNPYFRHYFLKDTFNHSSSKMQPNKPPPIMIHKAINFGNFNKLIMLKPIKTILYTSEMISSGEEIHPAGTTNLPLKISLMN